MPETIEYAPGTTKFFIDSISTVSFDNSACPGIEYEILFNGEVVTEESFPA